MQETEETQVQTLGEEDPLKEERTIYSRILVWEVPYMRSLMGSSPQGRKESDTLSTWHMTWATKQPWWQWCHCSTM